MNKKVTIVTGLWDLGRGNLNGWAKRDFQHYKNKFFELLEADVPMAIWIPRELEEDVRKIRKPENTKIYFKELSDFKSWFPFFDKVQNIRNKPEWKNFAGWLPESPQAALEYYNPMMMCKMFMVNDTAIYNPFQSTHFYWIDGGLTNTVGKNYFVQDNVFDNLPEYTRSVGNKFTFITYPYTANEEIHGFERKAMAKYCGVNYVDYVARGGFWGGKKESIHEMNNLYYGVLHDTLNSGYMGADECIFTILAHKHPNLVHRFNIEGNGLCWPFFEHLKNLPLPQDTIVKKIPEDEIEYIQTKEEAEMNDDGLGYGLYIVTFNFPKQLQLLLDTISGSNPELLSTKNKYLIDNSIDVTTIPDYDAIAKKYGFEVIRKGNLGVCGARQWAARHFHESDARYMIWFEDDMLMEKSTKLCKNGLNMHCDNWVTKCINIIEKENLDFVKISFSEFYGDHHKQWAWHNVPENIRQKYFPDGTHRMRWKESGCIDGISYLIGDVYYSNWPSVMTRSGNYKIFLETPYQSPFEQTIMSHSFQLQKIGRIRSAVLMASLVNHNRVYFYSKDIRKEV